LADERRHTDECGLELGGLGGDGWSPHGEVDAERD
jgi:hypothetical protein